MKKARVLAYFLLKNQFPVLPRQDLRQSESTKMSKFSPIFGHFAPDKSQDQIRISWVLIWLWLEVLEWAVLVEIPWIVHSRGGIIKASLFPCTCTKTNSIFNVCFGLKFLRPQRQKQAKRWLIEFLFKYIVVLMMWMSCHVEKIMIFCPRSFFLKMAKIF